jgi:protoporphyrinogen oxidase
MRIAIIGAGFTGLSAAYNLSKKGHRVFVFEKEKTPGGLAGGYKREGWEWALDKHYHHCFTNDELALNLAREIGQKMLTLKPKTSVLINNSTYQLDSPKSLILFSLLSFTQRLRMGLSLAFLRYNPFYKLLDKYTAEEYLPKIMGRKGFEMIWHPLFLAKFEKYAREVSLSWFWARVKKRTTCLAYPEKGFLAFAGKIVDSAKKSGAIFVFNSDVLEIGPGFLRTKKDNTVQKEKFDRIISTVPSPVFVKIAKPLPHEYQKKLESLRNLAATNLLLRLKKPFLSDSIYWLNVCEPKSKLMAVVEHTNFIDRKFYNNEFLVYIGHYVPLDHPYLKMTKEELLKELSPYLTRLNKDYQKNLIGVELSKNLFAQPVITVGYEKKIPAFETGIPGVYLANMDHVYPWDRGVNYAIELGEKIAKICCE